MISMDNVGDTAQETVTEPSVDEILQTEFDSTDPLDAPAEESVKEEPALEPKKEKEKEDAKPPKNESARETVKRILKERKEAAEEPSGDNGVKPKAKETGVEPSKEVEADIEVPAQLTAKGKEIFAKSPPQLKKEFSELVKSMQQHWTDGNMKMSAATKEAQSIVETVRPYFVSAKMQERGYPTESAFIGALVAAHQNLANPKTARQAWMAIGRDIGAVDENGDVVEGGAQPVSVENTPQFQALLEKYNALESRVENLSTEPLKQRMLNEIQSVWNETDAAGNLRYPELRDRAFFDRARHLVSAYQGTFPGEDYGQLYRRAWSALTGNPLNGSPTKPPNGNGEIEVNRRPTPAAVSVRGRTATPVSVTENEIPEEALTRDPRRTVEWAIRANRGR